MSTCERLTARFEAEKSNKCLERFVREGRLNEAAGAAYATALAFD